MKKPFCIAGWLALLPDALAHESWAPHTHAISGQHSDLFVLFAAGLVALTSGLLLLRCLCNRRRSKTSRGVARRS